jgi:hypothetical protein
VVSSIEMAIQRTMADALCAATSARERVITVVEGLELQVLPPQGCAICAVPTASLLT